MFDQQVPAEIKLLGAAVVVGLVQLNWAAGAARQQQNMTWAAGPRDTPMPISGVAARLDRAFRNFMETFPFFAAVVLGCALTAKTGTPLTLWGSALYVAMRAVYVPVYAAGWRPIRSIIWFASIAGLVMVLVALFR